MKNITNREYKIMGVFTAMIIGIILFFSNCTGNTISNNTKQIEVVVPGMHGVFDSVVPIPNKTKEFTKTISYKDNHIKVTKPFDMKKVDAFVNVLQDETNPIGPLSMYVKAVEKNTYTQVFKKSGISITVNAKTTGTLDYLDATYDVDDKKVTIDLPKEKVPVLSMYLGAQVFSKTTEIKPGIKFDLGIEVKDGDIITVGYGTQGGDNTVYAGYTKRIFQIKK